MLPETDRIELIAAMEMVDYVILFDEPRSLQADRGDQTASFGQRRRLEQ